jgi:prepilin-type N-terminal cleavage/methylation domain-containing protein
MRQRGFTLIELMVAVALSGITIALIFGIHGQMTAAFRGQANLSEIVESANAGRDLIIREARMAGQGFPQGTSTTHAIGIESASDPNDRWYGLEVINDADMPTLTTGKADLLIIRYGDGAIYDATFREGAPDWIDLPLADTLGFVAGQLLVVTSEAQDKGCALLAMSVDALQIGVDSTNCNDLADGDAVTVQPLVRIGYRLDPARPTLGVLQRSPSGGANADWEDMGIGFTQLQFALRRFARPGGADDDLDGDVEYDWYSSDNQEDPVADDNGQPVELGISIEARNVRENDAMRSDGTPAYTDLAAPNNNTFGDWGAACPTNPAFDPCGVDLINIPHVSRPARYTGNYAYRGTTSRVFLRSRMGSM